MKLLQAIPYNVICSICLLTQQIMFYVAFHLQIFVYLAITCGIMVITSCIQWMAEYKSNQYRQQRESQDHQRKGYKSVIGTK